MSQNTSHAVMAQRHEARDSLDDFPTQPWAVRAFCEYVLNLQGQTVWEPACNRGYMSRALAEYAAEVYESDVFDYGVGQVYDFLSVDSLLGDLPFGRPDWVVTNPPFRLLDEFLEKALLVAQRGVAMFGRVQMLEGIERYNTIWLPHDERATYAQYVERVPLVHGRLTPKGGTATAYGWVVIDKTEPRKGRMHIPPCRRRLERAGDYDLPAGVLA